MVRDDREHKYRNERRKGTVKRSDHNCCGLRYLVAIAVVVVLVALCHIRVKSSRASYGDPEAYVGTNVDKAAQGQRIEAFIEGVQNMGDEWEAHSWDPRQSFPMPLYETEDITITAKVSYFRRPDWIPIEAVPKTVEFNWDAPIMFEVCCFGEPKEGGSVTPPGCDWVEKGSSVRLQAFANEGWKVVGASEEIFDDLAGDVNITFVFERIQTEKE